MLKSSMQDHLWFMNIALEEAESAYKANEVPVGAVLVGPTGAILSKIDIVGNFSKGDGDQLVLASQVF